MSYIKLFEAHSAEDYQKALFKVKHLIKNNKPNDEIINFINTYASDDAKELDSLRIILNRIAKEYLNFGHYVPNINKINKKTKRPEALYYYMIGGEHQKFIDNFLTKQEESYKEIIDTITTIDLTLIKFVFNRLFEILHWVNETGQEKKKIYMAQYSNPDKTQTISKFNSLSDFDFENEVDEVKRLIRIGKIQIAKAINSIG